MSVDSHNKEQYQNDSANDGHYSGSRAGDADEVRDARAFSLKRCSVVARLKSPEDTITIFRVSDVDSANTTTATKQPSR